MKNLILFFMLSPLAWSQTTIAPKTTVAPKTTIAANALPVWVFKQAADNFSCPTGTTCNVTISSTTSGSILVCAMLDGVNSTNHITSCSGGGGTWTLCPTSSCVVTNANLFPIDAAYNLAGTGGATTITVNVATSSSFFGAVVGEWDCTANCPANALDKIASSNTSTASCGTCTLSSFTSPTVGDLAVQLVSADNTPLSSPSSPYVIDGSLGLFVYSLGITSGAAPTVTQSPSGALTSTGLTFK